MPSPNQTNPYLLELQLRRERVPSFDIYPFSLPAIRDLDTLPLHPAVTFFTGENGSGKSTILEALAIACGFNAEGGTRNFTVSTHPSHSVLHEYVRVVRGVRRPQDGFFLRAESLYNVATEVDRVGAASTSYGGPSLHHRSHGESFMAIMEHRFRGDGLYIMDEPEAALSPSRQLTLITMIHQFIRQGAQLIIATHSPLLLAYPNARILRFNAGGMMPISYEETEAFQITRDFVNRYPAMLNVLLADEGED